MSVEQLAGSATSFPWKLGPSSRQSCGGGREWSECYYMALVLGQLLDSEHLDDLSPVLSTLFSNELSA